MRQHAETPASATARASGDTAWGWLRKRLLPRGDNVLMLSTYIALIISMVSLTAARTDLAPWAFLSGIIILSTMLVLHATLDEQEQRFGEERAHLQHLLLNGGLFLAVTWLALARHTFLPYLLFILVGQAIVMLRWWRSAVYGVVLFGGWLLILWLKGISATNLVENFISVGMGLIFTSLFCAVIVGYSRQREHAERLLAQLQAADAELAAAREREKDLAVVEERIRLARDIHDGLGHHLTVLNVQLQAAAKLVERDPARAAQTIATCREVAQSAMDEVRQSVAAMRRTPLDGRTLDQALASLVEEFDRRSPLEATLVQHGTLPELSPAVAMTLYRAAQEGLTNAQKHAHAGKATVKIDCGPAHIRLAIRDNGQIATINGKGFGLAGLRERAEQLGGSLRAGPHAEGGFELCIELPVLN